MCAEHTWSATEVPAKEGVGSARGATPLRQRRRCGAALVARTCSRLPHWPPGDHGIQSNSLGLLWWAPCSMGREVQAAGAEGSEQLPGARRGARRRAGAARAGTPATPATAATCLRPNRVEQWLQKAPGVTGARLLWVPRLPKSAAAPSLTWQWGTRRRTSCNAAARWRGLPAPGGLPGWPAAIPRAC